MEIQSIQDKIAQLEVDISKEELRVKNLEDQQSKKQVELESIQQSLQSKREYLLGEEKKIDQLNASLSRNGEKSMMATTEQMIKANESEKSQLEADLESSEETSFALLEEIEEQENLESEAIEFLKNIPTSINEVKEIVSEINSKAQNQIKNHQERLDDLFRSANPNLLSAFKNLQKKIPKPVAIVEKDRCGACQGLLDNELMRIVHSYSDLGFCPICGRLLISIDAQY